MSEMEKRMNEHWEFLEKFIKELIELDVIESSYQEIYPETRMELIKYGFKLAWPHAWKHGIEQYLNTDIQTQEVKED